MHKQIIPAFIYSRIEFFTIKSKVFLSFPLLKPIQFLIIFSCFYTNGLEAYAPCDSLGNVNFERNEAMISSLIDSCLGQFDQFKYFKDGKNEKTLKPYVDCLLTTSEENNHSLGKAYCTFFQTLSTVTLQIEKGTKTNSKEIEETLIQLQLQFEKGKLKEMSFWCFIVAADYFFRSDPQKSMVYHKQAISFCEKIGERFPLLGICYNDLGRLHLRSHDNYFKAKEQFGKSIELFNEMSSTDLNILKYKEFAIFNLGNIYEGLEMYDLALEYLEQSLEIERMSKDVGGTMWSESAIVGLLFNVGKVEEGQRRSKELIDRAILIDNTYIHKYNLRILGKYFLDIADYKQAKSFFEKLLSLDKTEGTLSSRFRFVNDWESIAAMTHLSEIHLKYKNYDQAINFASKVLKEEGESKEFTLICMKVLLESYAAKNEKDKALSYTQPIFDLQDTLNAERWEKDKSKLVFKYEGEKLKEELLVSELKNKVQQKKIQFSVIGLFCLSLFCASLLSFYFQLKNKNKQLVSQKEEIIDQKKLVEKQKEQLEIQQTTLNVKNHKLLEKENLLLRVNSRLESYAQVISHDLKAPLRNINGFSNRLVKKYDHLLDEEGKTYTQFISEGAKRMSNLISDVLHSSMDKELDIQLVDLNRTLENVKSTFSYDTDNIDAEIEIGLLPTIKGIPTELEQLFQNLIGNAIKYRKEDRPLKLKVTASKFGSFWNFTVKDNGQGIPELYHDGLFRKYERGERKGNQGNGLGLLICKNIVESYKGTIYCMSEVDVGTAFHFTLNEVRSELSLTS